MLYVIGNWWHGIVYIWSSILLRYYVTILIVDIAFTSYHFYKCAEIILKVKKVVIYYYF